MKPTTEKRRSDPPHPSVVDQSSDDPRLLAAVQEYIAAIEAGRRPNRQEFLARHSAIAKDLSACLQGLAFVNSAAARINGPVTEIPVAAVDLTAGRPLGDFQLLQEIGRGGMGVVYQAIQLSLGRRVAVKILPMAASLDSRHLQRFRNEAQAAAQLHHTNIVPVYAVGYERSVHFYAMQLIDGQSLEDVIVQLRGAKPPDTRSTRPVSRDTALTEEWAPSSAKPPIEQNRLKSLEGTGASSRDSSRIASKSTIKLSMLHSAKRFDYFRAVAALGMQAAEALFYAHQQGIVHRDIKPANLLLDSNGTLWVTDFGLAMMYADNGLTQTGDLLGTLRYMSPEQASGRAVVLDQRTDIYSLGMTLYEMLTLERALPGHTREELLHQISSVNPRSLRSIDRKIPEELETIIGKATAKEASERYPNAQALADDLQRFLKDEPVLARPPSLLNKSIKWTRRHKTIAFSTLVILVLGFIGSLVSSVLIAREQSRTKAAYLREQRRAVESAEQRQLAEKSFDQARQAVDFFTSIAIKGLPTDPRLLQVRWQLLETSMAYYQSFLDQRKNDPSISAQLTAASAQVSTVLAELAAVDELLRTNFEIRFLTERSVQEDLGLTTAQATSAADLASDVGSKPPTVKPDSTALTSQQIRESVSLDSAQREALLQQVLTLNQAKRLHEISRQIRGVFAFSDTDVARVLALTSTQKNVARSACAEFHNRSHHGPKFPGEESEQAIMQSLTQRVLSQFTARQLDDWQSLTGQSYTGRIPRYSSWFNSPRHGPGEADDFDGPLDRDSPGGHGGPDKPNDHGPDGPDDHSPGGHHGPPPDEDPSSHGPQGHGSRGPSFSPRPRDDGLPSDGRGRGRPR